MKRDNPIIDYAFGRCTSSKEKDAAEQAKNFLNAVKDHGGCLFYILDVTTGMREGELLGLHGEDVDLENKRLHVRHQVQVIAGEGLVINEHKTKKSRRTIALTSMAVDVLKELGDGEGLVFTTSTATRFPLAAWCASSTRSAKNWAFPRCASKTCATRPLHCCWPRTCIQKSSRRCWATRASP